MKILVDYTEEEKVFKPLKINAAKYLSDYVIRLKFNDGIEKIIDFKPFLTKSIHPSVKKYLDEKQFANFEIINGNLNWNDYDMIFPLEDLYMGKI